MWADIGAKDNDREGIGDDKITVRNTDRNCVGGRAVRGGTLFSSVGVQHQAARRTIMLVSCWPARTSGNAGGVGIRRHAR